MRSTPTRLPDDLLAPACRAMGLESPEQLSPALRAAVQAQLRAQIAGRPQRRVGRTVAPRCPARQTTLAFDDSFVDIKRRAANDLDEA